MLTDATVLRVVPGIASAEVDGETTVLDPRTGLYFGLEDVSARIWALLAAPIAVGALVGVLRAEYEVSAEACRADVLAFADELLARGLIEIVT